jgi:hypothetical protein
MTAIDLLLLGVAVAIWGFVGFSLMKQYRYATQLFDMLPLYPILVLLAILPIPGQVLITVGIIGTVLLSGGTMIITLILLYFSVKWELDYSWSKYREFLYNLGTEHFSVRTFEDYIKNQLVDDKINVIIRHDVDISLKRTMKMVEIEKAEGIRSTYFFRLYAEKYTFEEAIPLIKKLSDDGFGIGLHYETLSIVKGDRQKAIALLDSDIQRLREIAPVNVVAAHGQKGYKNRDIWEDVDKEALQITSAYDMKYDLYLSDAGGKRLSGMDKKYLFDRIYEASPGQTVQVLIHPDWWINL